MKNIEIDDELYQYIASNTKFIGESASQILRRLLNFDEIEQQNPETLSNDAQPNKADLPAQNTATKADKKSKESKENPASELVDFKASIEKPAKPASNNDCRLVAGELNIFDLINKQELAAQRGAVGRFLVILGNLYRVHPNQFDEVLDIRGRDRLYFATSEEALLENGSSTKPKQIPESNFWVITNSNTTKKKLMLTDVAHVLGYSSTDAEKIRDFL